MVQTAHEEEELTPRAHHLSLREHSSPVTRLFPELLLEVFFYSAYGSGGLVIPSHLIRITHVCHYWRALTISCPSLWAVISLPSRSAPTFVQRSLNVPLTLQCNFDSDTSSSQLKRILSSNRFRIKHLDLNGPSRIIGPVMEKVLGECFLSGLSIVNPTSADDENTDDTDGESIADSDVESTEDSDDEGTDDWVTDDESTDDPGDEGTDDDSTDDEGGFWLPDSPFIAQTSSKPMYRLKLAACGFQWDSPLYYSGLTILHLIDIAKLQRPSASRLLGILSALPGLQDLALVRVAPLDLEHSFENLIPLPELAHLRIEDQSLMCSRLLSHLDTSASVTIDIVCSKGAETKGAETDNFDVSWIISASARCSFPDLAYRCMRLVVEKGALKFALDNSSGRYLTIVFEKTNCWRPKKLSQILTLARDRFFAEDIPELHLGGKIPDEPHKPTASLLLESRTHWQTLSAFDELRVIRLNGCRPVMLLEVLLEQAMLCIGISILPSTRHIQPDGTSRQLIKNLDSIHFADFDFDAEVMAGGQVDFIDLLTAFLWALRQGRSPTPHIYIHRGCTGITNSRVGQLRKFTDVTWESKRCSSSWEAPAGDDFELAMETLAQLSALCRLGEISEII
ncbi:hypothetical protein AB1N83_009280 [Pleurotus pulmonarius]